MQCSLQPSRGRRRVLVWSHMHPGTHNIPLDITRTLGALWTFVGLQDSSSSWTYCSKLLNLQVPSPPGLNSPHKQTTFYQTWPPPLHTEHRFPPGLHAEAPTLRPVHLRLLPIPPNKHNHQVCWWFTIEGFIWEWDIKLGWGTKPVHLVLTEHEFTECPINQRTDFRRQETETTTHLLKEDTQKLSPPSDSWAPSTQQTSPGPPTSVPKKQKSVQWVKTQPLPSLEDISRSRCLTKAILGEPSHPAYHLFDHRPLASPKMFTSGIYSLLFTV